MARLIYSLGTCEWGTLLVARSVKGLRAAIVGSDEASLVAGFLAGVAYGQYVRRDVPLDDVRAVFDNPCQAYDGPLDLHGPPFYRRVWRALREIPCGETRTYGQLAEELGKPGGAQAVGAACGANALAVIVPCHRVLANNGDLTGYRWGVEMKRTLLQLEGALEPDLFS